jgi:hypothetical protein
MIVGTRGTDQLAPEQRPGLKRKRTRRTQPYRRKVGRPAGQSLTAMLRGAPWGLPNPMDAQRRMVKRRGR